MIERIKQLNDVLDLAPDAMVVIDREGAILVANSQTEKMFGYNREELLGQAVEILIPSHYRDDHPAQRDRYAANPQFRPMGTGRELWGMRKDGNEFPVEISLGPIETEDGTVLVSTIRDITERKNAEQILHDSKVRSRTLLEGSPVCNKIIDLNSRLQYMSKAGIDQLKIADITPFYGCTFPPTLYSEPMQKLVTEHLDRAIAGETSSVECAVNDTEGNEVWFDTTFVPARDEQGQIEYIIVTSVDITERKRAETALAKSQERLDLAVRGASDGVWDAEIESGKSGKEYWSPRYKELLGYEEDEIEASRENFQAFLHPDDLPVVDHAIQGHLEANRPYDIEFRMQTKSGEYRWFQSRGKAMRDDDGKPYRMTGSIRDITERKQVEVDAQKHRDQLAHVARVSTMGEMATGIAHELNQPLTAIASYGYAAELMIENETLDPDQLREVLGKMKSQAIRGGDIVRRLREFVRKTEPARAITDLHSLVHDVVMLVEPDVRETKTKLVLRLDDTLPNVLIDNIQIQQVLVNLIRNALDAMQNLPVDVREIVLSTRVAGDGHIEVTVRDSGTGMSDDALT